MKRRELLKALPLGFAASCIPILGSGSARASAVLRSPMLSALTNQDAESDRIVVVLWLRGGNDNLNTVIPFEDPLYDSNRKKTGFSQPDDKKLLIHRARPDLAFNPAMASCFPLFQEGKMAVVQNVGFPHNDLSHFRASDIWTSGSDGDVIEQTGWIARWLELDNPDYPTTLPEDPLAVSIGDYSNQMFNGHHGQMDILVQDPQNYQSTNALTSSGTPNTYGGQELKFVNDLISISDTYASRFQKIIPPNAKNAVTYPDTKFAQNLRHTAWCIASGLKTKVYFTQEDGFDTHYYENTKDATVEGQAMHLKIVFDAIAAFQQDLELLGVADRVLTMTYSEFGRRTSENGAFDSGTDHGTSGPQFIIGTKVNGELYGKHPNLSEVDHNGNLLNEYEFRSVYAAVLGDWFGVSDSTAHAILSPGRPHDPFVKDFGINSSSVRQSLIQNAARSRVEKSSLSPAILEHGCYPNPFVKTTTLRFKVANASDVTIEIYDAAAKLIERNPLGRLYQGEHEMKVKIVDATSGIYYYRITAGGQTTVGSASCER